MPSNAELNQEILNSLYSKVPGKTEPAIKHKSNTSYDLNLLNAICSLEKRVIQLEKDGKMKVSESTKASAKLVKKYLLTEHKLSTKPLKQNTDSYYTVTSSLKKERTADRKSNCSHANCNKSICEYNKVILKNNKLDTRIAG